MSRCVILLPASLSDPCEVCFVEGHTVTPVKAEGVSGAARARAIAFAPAESATHHTVRLSGVRESERLKAALFSIEDELGQAVDTLHVVMERKSSPQADDSLYLVDAGLMSHWCAELSRLGFDKSPIIPELSLIRGNPVIIGLRGRFLVNSGCRRYGLDGSLPDEILLTLCSNDGAVFPVLGLEAAQRLGVAPSGPADSHPAAELLRRYDSTHGINLRTRRFAPRAGAAGLTLSQWRAPAVLAAIAAALSFAMLGVETLVIREDIRRMESEAQDRFAAFDRGNTGAREIHRAVRATYEAGPMERRSGFRSTSAALYTAIAGMEDARIEAIHFDSVARAFRAELKLGEIGDDAHLRQRLEAMGWQVRTVDVRPEHTGIICEILIEVSA